MPRYTPAEMMIVAAARALQGAGATVVGVGGPSAVCNLARRTTSPSLELIYESGVYGARPSRQPLSIGDPALVSGALSVISMADLFGFYLQGGLIDIALLGGAQIDRHGNLNTTVIGDYNSPSVRLPGSGGACEIAINARTVMYIIRLSTRTFVDRLDFCTSPGHRHPANDAFTPHWQGGGPQRFITDKSISDFSNAENEMLFISINTGTTLAYVRQSIGWDIR